MALPGRSSRRYTKPAELKPSGESVPPVPPMPPVSPATSVDAQPTISLGEVWRNMAKTVRDVDEDKIRDYKEDIDTLLVFAGLYSAVLTAFLIESYKHLQPDTQDEIAYLMRLSLTRSYTLDGQVLRSSVTDPTMPAFEAPLWALRVNGLWFASLICSLSTGSIGMLAKQWLREYLAVEWISPQDRLRARQYRHPALSRWKVFEITAVLPMLLQLSLGLFFLGLSIFTFSVDKRVGRSTIPLILAWAFFVTATIIAPLFSPRCPFKIPVLRSVMAFGRQHLTRPIYRNVGLPCRKEEHEVIRKGRDDIEIVLSYTETMLDDGLLGTTWEVFRHSTPSGSAVVRFVQKVLHGRLDAGTAQSTTCDSISFPPELDLHQLSSGATTCLLNVIEWTFRNHSQDLSGKQTPDWAIDLIRVLVGLSPVKHAGPMHLIFCQKALLQSVISAIDYARLSPREIIKLVKMAVPTSEQYPDWHRISDGPSSPSVGLHAEWPDVGAELGRIILGMLNFQSRSRELNRQSDSQSDWIYDAMKLLFSAGSPFRLSTEYFVIEATNLVLCLTLEITPRLAQPSGDVSYLARNIVQHRLSAIALNKPLVSTAGAGFASETTVLDIQRDAPALLGSLIKHMERSLTLSVRKLPALASNRGDTHTWNLVEDALIIFLCHFRWQTTPPSWMLLSDDAVVMSLLHVLRASLDVQTSTSPVALTNLVYGIVHAYDWRNCSRTTEDDQIKLDAVPAPVVNLLVAVVADTLSDYRDKLGKDTEGQWAARAVNVIMLQDPKVWRDCSALLCHPTVLPETKNRIESMSDESLTKSQCVDTIPALLREGILSLEAELRVIPLTPYAGIIDTCYFALRIYWKCCKRMGGPGSIQALEGDGGFQHWNKLWQKLAQLIERYHESSPARDSSSESISAQPDTARNLDGDRQMAKACMAEMALLEGDSSIFPSTLRDALHMFLPPEQPTLNQVGVLPKLPERVDSRHHSLELADVGSISGTPARRTGHRSAPPVPHMTPRSWVVRKGSVDNLPKMPALAKVFAKQRSPLRERPDCSLA